MKVFDMHIHIGEEKIESAKLIDRFDAAGVYGGGLISAPPDEAQAAMLKLPFEKRLDNVLQWKKGYEGRLYSFLWIHPFEKDVEAKVKTAAENGIDGFKIICDTFNVYSDECMRTLRSIEEAKKPVMFHTGILWGGKVASKYNRPLDWESMLNLDKIKFSMGHCSWPWVDECIALYGKFLYYYNVEKKSEMFFDITPGTPEIYRRELLFKLFNVGYDVEDNIMFGTDSYANDYKTEWVTKWLEMDNGIMDELGIDEAVRQKVYCDNYLRFINGGDKAHRTLHIDG